MTEEKHLYQEIAEPKSHGASSFPLLNQLKILPALSVVIIFASVAIKYLTELDLIVGLSCPLSWRNSTLFWCCFVLYSLGLVLISLHISQRLFSKDATSDPVPPNALTRLRSHLTFLPLTHFIRQHVVASEYITSSPFNGQLRSFSLHTNGNDKEYLSRLEFQRDSLIDAILEGCVFPWYEKISDEKTFPMQSKHILQASFDRLAIKFRQMDRTNLIKEVIEIVHLHWKNYCEAMKKVSSPEDDLAKNFKYVHDSVTTKEAHSKHYEALSCLLLKELIVPDLQSTIVCQFLSGILVKGFILYYVELISDPKWINASLKKLISSGTVNSLGSEIPITNGSSQESVCDSSCKGKDDDAEHKIRLTESAEDSNESILAESYLPNEPRRTIRRSSLVSKCEAHEDNPSSSILAIKPEFEDKNKKSTSVSAALEGLLSATALPLLPEGSSYNLAALDSLEISENTNDANSKASNNEHSKQDAGYTIGASEAPQSPPDNQTVAATENKNKNEAPVVKPLLSPMNRHYSLDDSGKTKTTLGGEKATKSLDEAQENCSVTRQEEFDLCIGDPQKLRIDHSYDKQDVSPMYDEPEDFAATIAKLRSLLEQRESQKNLVENVTISSRGSETEATPETVNAMEAIGIGIGSTATEMDADVFSQSRSSPEKHSPESNNMQSTQSQPIKNSFDSVRPSLNSQSSASSLGSDASVGSTTSHCSWDTDKLEKIVDELEESGPVVNRFFLNVAIPKTESCSDSSGHFVLYSIQYEGVYLEENDDGQLEKLVLRTTTIKRRFQEFIMLQSCLEESSLWRPHIKGIKAPNKWLNLSFSKSDNTTLNQRKINLERYLQQLCYHPVLGFCPHLRQFMAYGEEGFQAFTTSDAIPLHRFDKLAKKFTGVFNSLREALPSFESELLPAPSSPDASGKSPTTDSKARSLFASFLRAESKCPLSGKLEDGADKETDSVSNIVDSNLKSKADNEDNNLHSDAELPFELNLGEPISTTSETLLEGTEPLSEAVMDAVYPLAVAMTQLLCDVLWLPHHRPHSASVSAFLSISGKSFDNYIQDSLDLFLSQESILGYLEAITAAIRDWSTFDDQATVESDVELVSEDDLKSCLKQKIPVWVRWMWGRSRVDATIDRLTKVCQNTILNQDLILSLIELLFSKLLEAVEIEVTEGFK